MIEEKVADNKLSGGQEIKLNIFIEPTQITYKMNVLLRDAYNYEFEGSHEVTPQDEEEPEESTFDFKFLLFMTWISIVQAVNLFYSVAHSWS